MTKKNISKLFNLCIITICIFFVSASLVNAQAITDYEVLAPLPGIGDTAAGTSNLNTYLPAAFNLTVGIAIALAFIVITFGGVTYATSDALSGKQNGRELITNALWGMLLVIGSYTILYSINPQMLNFDILFARPNPPEASSTIVALTQLSVAELSDDSNIRGRLRTAGITVNALACTPGRTRGCTNVNALPETAITGLIALRNACSCPFVITGGTEGGHRTHGPGRPVVDLRPSTGLNRFIWNNVNSPNDGYSRTITLPNNQRITFTYETLGGNAGGTSTGDHWHVVIN